MKKITGYFIIPLFLMACTAGSNKEVKKRYADGNPKQIDYYDLKEGDSLLIKQEIYFQNGKRMLSGEYNHDHQINGDWTFWYENGKKNCAGSYINGKRSGDWSVWDVNGKLLGREHYTVEEFEDGLPKTIRFFEKEGDELVRTAEIHFYENHVRKTEGPVKDNKKNGLWVAWYDDGTTWSEGVFAFDVSHGLRTVWHKNGQKFYEGEYRFGDRIGVWKFWNEKGEQIREVDYGTNTNQ